MSPAPWGETLHRAAAAIVTRAHCCLTAAGHCYVMLGTIKFFDKSVDDNSARRLDHCDVIASRSGFGVATGVPHSEVELQTEFKSFTAAHLGSNTYQHKDWTLGGTYIKSSRSVYAPHLVQSVQFIYLSTEGVAMLTGFPRTRWPRRWFSESYAVRISVKISRICEFRVIMGIMTGLLGCCSSSTLGSRANDYVKTLGFWLHHSPCSLGCWTNNTLAARPLSSKHPGTLQRTQNPPPLVGTNITVTKMAAILPTART